MGADYVSRARVPILTQPEGRVLFEVPIDLTQEDDVPILTQPEGRVLFRSSHACCD